MFSQSDLELLLQAQDDLNSLSGILERHNEELSSEFQQGWMFATLSLSFEKIAVGLNTVFPKSGALLELPAFPDECPADREELVVFFEEMNQYFSSFFKLIADNEEIAPEKDEDFKEAVARLIAEA